MQSWFVMQFGTRLTSCGGLGNMYGSCKRSHMTDHEEYCTEQKKKRCKLPTRYSLHDAEGPEPQKFVNSSRPRGLDLYMMLI